MIGFGFTIFFVLAIIGWFMSGNASHSFARKLKLEDPETWNDLGKPGDFLRSEGLISVFLVHRFLFYGLDRYSRDSKHKQIIRLARTFRNILVFQYISSILLVVLFLLFINSG